jgi:CRP/FNR family transcriptional regulator, cyclic AMP receptor protein
MLSFPNKPMPINSSQIELLSRLPAPDRVELLQLGVMKQFARGEFVFQAGNEARSVFLLITGRIKIYQPSSVGKEAILWFCFDGELFGLAEAARGGSRAVSAQTCVASDALCIAQDQFMAFLATHPMTAQIVVQLLACRLRVLSDVVINLISDDVRTRILKVLLQLGARCGRRGCSGVELGMALTHQEIADMIGSTRQTVTSTLGQLERDGLLRIDDHKIQLTGDVLLSQLGLPLPI